MQEIGNIISKLHEIQQELETYLEFRDDITVDYRGSLTQALGQIKAAKTLLRKTNK